MKNAPSYSLASRLVGVVILVSLLTGLSISLLSYGLTIQNSVDQIHRQLTQTMTAQFPRLTQPYVSIIWPGETSQSRIYLLTNHGSSAPDESAIGVFFFFSQSPQLTTQLATDSAQQSVVRWTWDLSELKPIVMRQLMMQICRDLGLVSLLAILMLSGLHQRLLTPVQQVTKRLTDILSPSLNTAALNSSVFHSVVDCPQELKHMVQRAQNLSLLAGQNQQENSQLKQSLEDLQRRMELKIREMQLDQQQLEVSNRQLQSSNQQLQDQLHDANHIQEQNDHQQRAASLEHLAAGMAHEINNPVAVVYSNIATLRGYLSELLGLTSQYQQAESYIDNGTLRNGLMNLRQSIDFDFLQHDSDDLIRSSQAGLERVRNIVAELSSFADASAKLQESIMIEEIMAESLRSMPKLPSINVSNMMMGLPPIWVVRDQVKVAFQKVLRNAIEAMPNGGKIEIAAVEESHSLSVMIKDNGCGMSAEQLSHAIEPFYSQKEIGQGTGLGLTVASNLIKHQGGRLQLESQLGSGTQVTMHFPLATIPVALEAQSA